MDDQMEGPTNVWADLGPIKPLPCSVPRMAPLPEIVRIAAELGLRYPPRSTSDEEAHAARVALLAEDCADIDPIWLDAAARDWAKRSPFFPRACELREEALAIGRISRSDRILPAPYRAPPPAKPEAPPLTEAEVRKLPRHLLDMGVKLGEIDPALAEQIRDQAA